MPFERVSFRTTLRSVARPLQEEKKRELTKTRRDTNNDDEKKMNSRVIGCSITRRAAGEAKNTPLTKVVRKKKEYWQTC